MDGVTLAVAHAEALTLAVSEVVREGVNVGECEPLELLLATALRDAVAQTLCVALPHCERVGVKLAECVALPHCESEEVKLADTQVEPLWVVVSEEEVEDVRDGDCVPLVLPLSEALPASEGDAPRVSDAVALLVTAKLPLRVGEGVGVGLPSQRATRNDINRDAAGIAL
jgi:hypothetical protein